MGITGLLPFLKNASTSVHVKQFEGQTVAIDTYCWIYRGAFSCAEELGLGKKADGHVKYVLRYVNRLLEWGIKPILVFDGSCLPSKKGTEQKRKESKEMYRKKAAQCLLEGKRTEARECFQRCIDCTPQMALDVIQAVHAIGVDVCVAPFEADAQLTYLNKIGLAQVIITEDSDLILFGCEKVLYKLDYNGNGTLVEKEKIISITQFDCPDNFERFRWMCILSGCDYLESLPGIGLGKAKKLLKTVQKSDIDYIFKQLPRILKMPNIQISNEYIEKFKHADLTFKYQIVFDPRQRKMTPLHQYQDNDEQLDLSFAGYFYDNEEALQHSLGNIEVHTRAKHYDFDPDNWNYIPPIKFKNNPPPYMRSIWSKNYQTYKNSNPFNRKEACQNFFKASCERAEKKENNDVNRPVTLGMSKSIRTPFRSPVDKKQKRPKIEKKVLNENSLLNKDNIAKRKFEMLSSFDDDGSQDEQENLKEHQFELQCSETDSGYITSSNDIVMKRCKTMDVKNDIDNLLSDYKTDSNNHETEENFLSPIKELLIHKEKVEESIKEEFIHFSSSIQSPILAKKSNLDSFKINKSQKFKRILENSPIINNKFQAESPTAITHSPLAHVNESSKNMKIEKTSMILDDIQTIDVSPEITYKNFKSVNNVKKFDINSKPSVQSNKSKKTTVAKPIDAKNTKPITSFFSSKFGYEKTNKMARFN